MKCEINIMQTADRWCNHTRTRKKKKEMMNKSGLWVLTPTRMVGCLFSAVGAMIQESAEMQQVEDY